MLTVYLAVLDNETDRAKIELLYKSYYHFMIASAMRCVHDEHVAQDIVHQCILRLIRHLETIDLNKPLITKSYLFVTVKNAATDHLRREEKRPASNPDSTESSQVDPSPSPVEVLISNEGYDFLVQCIDSLSDTYKDVLRLKYINKLKESEIAEALGLSAKTVSVRIVRGKQILQKKIRESKYYEE